MCMLLCLFGFFSVCLLTCMLGILGMLCVLGLISRSCSLIHSPQKRQKKRESVRKCRANKKRKMNSSNSPSLAHPPPPVDSNTLLIRALDIRDRDAPNEIQRLLNEQRCLEVDRDYAGIAKKRFAHIQAFTSSQHPAPAPSSTFGTPSPSAPSSNFGAPLSSTLLSPFASATPTTNPFVSMALA